MPRGGKSESGVIGVYRVNRKDGSAKWQAEINAQGQRHYLGTFNTMQEAIDEHRAYCMELFGQPTIPGKFDPYIPSPQEKAQLEQMEWEAPIWRREHLLNMMKREAL